MTVYQLTPLDLRSQAEAQFAAMPVLAEPTPDSRDKLLHELQVHQIELEMQNQALRDTQTALEESRDRYLYLYKAARHRYFTLYEFAPVAYLTLTEQGLIQEINLTGATLLGGERQKLLQQQFAGFIDSADSNHWHFFSANR